MLIMYIYRDDSKGEGQASTHHLSQLACLPSSSSTAPYPVPIVGVSHDPPSAPPPTPMLLVGQGMQASPQSLKSISLFRDSQ